MQWLCVLYLLLLLLVATLGKPSYPLWNNTLPRQRGKERQVNSYLFPKATSGDDSVEFIRDIMEVIHAKQHPPKEECKSRRLMIVQMSSTSFEGTGSILKQAMIAMAVAMHSNRTLVWGLGLPFMFEHSKELWAGPTRKKLKIMDKDLDCATNADPTGGPYGCFFQPLSTCTVNDISPEELLAFSHNSANETARVLMAEIRKGISLYHPPFGLFDYIWANQNSSRKYPFAGKEGYLWSSAVAAYIFRLKDSLLVDFQKLGNTLFDGGNTWGLHVRHGDLKSLADVYTYKQVYDFNDYFRAAKKLTLELKVSPSQLFVSTDSTKANQVDQLFSRYLEIDAKGLDDTEDEYEEEDEDEYYDDEEEDDGDEEEQEESEEDSEELPKGFGWFDKSIPKVISVGNEVRYRTEHGSHTVAANGGCLKDPSYADKGMRCAMQYEDILLYQSLDEHRSVPRSYRLMRVLLESIEDIYLLSMCDALIAQASSHFSTMAAMLMTARLGVSNVLSNVVYLDIENVKSGLFPTALLHGMNLLNGTHVDKNDPTVGALRWQLYTESFVTGMRDHPSLHIKSKINPWSPENRMKLVNNLPHLAEKVFYTEAKSWLTTKYKPVWPGHCPGAVPNGQDPKDYIVEVINLGVDHLDKSHTGQALQCWTDALRVLESNKNYKTSLRDAYSVVTGNMRALRQLRYSEMVINENKDSLDYLQYDDKHFQEESVPRPRPEKSSGPNGMMSLEDINEEIIRLEERLKNLKASRDKMLELSKNFAKNYPRDLGYDSARLTKREL